MTLGAVSARQSTALHSIAQYNREPEPFKLLMEQFN